MAVKFDVDCAISKGPGAQSTKFKESLRKTLTYLNQDPNINDVRMAAYLLATANIESNYSLARWEADYACNSWGKSLFPPCESALNYYRSTNGGKLNYYNLGVDPKGYPYYGRGLIQLTGKANYQSYGNKLGVDLVNQPQLAMRDDISYRIASDWMSTKTFKYLEKGDMRAARKSVNGGYKALSEINNSYSQWYKALTECGAKPSPGGAGIPSENDPTQGSTRSGSGLPGTDPNRLVGAPSTPPPPPKKLRTFGVVVIGDLGSQSAGGNSSSPKATNPKSKQMEEVETRTVTNPTIPLDRMIVPVGESSGNIDRAKDATVSTAGNSSVKPKNQRSKKNNTQRPVNPEPLNSKVSTNSTSNTSIEKERKKIESSKRQPPQKNDVPVPSDPKIVTAPSSEEVTNETASLTGQTFTIDENAESSLGNAVKSMGGSYPVISINGYTFNQQEVMSFTIDCTGFYPVCDLTIKLSSGPFLSRNFPKDGDLISVFIRSKQDQLKPIRNDYVITQVSTSNSKDPDGSEVTVFMTGNLRVPLLYAETSRSITGTSIDALLEVSKDLQLGFVTNETEMADSMTWRCAFETYKDFLRNITKHSWKDDSSFFTCYVDIYYNLNFINLNKVYSIDDRAEMREGLVRSDLNVDETSDISLAHTKTKHLLTNYPQYRGTNYYVESIQLKNNGGITNLVNGYRRHTYFYDKETKTYQNMYVDPMTTEGAEQTKVLLKGRRGESYYRDQTKRKWMGIQDVGNVHPYYKFAAMHNFQNLQEQDKLNLVTILPSVNMNFYRSQRVPVLFTITRDPSRAQAAGFEVDRGKEFGWTADRFITGNYCVTGIRYTYRGGLNPSFFQEVTLSKREWTMPTADPIYIDGQKYSL